MSDKKNKQKTKGTRKKSAYLFNKKKNKKGKFFYYDPETGFRVPSYVYNLQFDISGKRVPKAVTKEALNVVKSDPEMIKQKGRNADEIAREISGGLYTIQWEQMEAERALEIPFTDTIQYWDLRTEIAENMSVEIFRIKLPNSETHGSYSRTRATELIEVYQNAINTEVSNFNKKYQDKDKKKSIYINPAKLFKDIDFKGKKAYIDLNELEVNGIDENKAFEFVENVKDRFLLEWKD